MLQPSRIANVNNTPTTTTTADRTSRRYPRYHELAALQDDGGTSSQDVKGLLVHGMSVRPRVPIHQAIAQDDRRVEWHQVMRAHRRGDRLARLFEVKKAIQDRAGRCVRIRLLSGLLRRNRDGERLIHRLDLLEQHLMHLLLVFASRLRAPHKRLAGELPDLRVLDVQQSHRQVGDHGQILCRQSLRAGAAKEQQIVESEARTQRTKHHN